MFDLLVTFQALNGTVPYSNAYATGIVAALLALAVGRHLPKSLAFSKCKGVPYHLFFHLCCAPACSAFSHDSLIYPPVMNAGNGVDMQFRLYPAEEMGEVEVRVAERAGIKTLILHTDNAEQVRLDHTRAIDSRPNAYGDEHKC